MPTGYLGIDLGAESGQPIHIVDGGAKNRPFNHFFADRTGRDLIAGQAEATAIGNVLMRASAQEQVGSPSEARGCDVLFRS